MKNRPEELTGIQNAENMEEFVREIMKIRQTPFADTETVFIKNNHSGYWKVDRDELRLCNGAVTASGRYMEYPTVWDATFGTKVTAVYFDSDGQCWLGEVRFEDIYRVSRNGTEIQKINKGHMYFQLNNKLFEANTFETILFINSKKQLAELLKKKNKYAYELCEEQGLRMDRMLLCPSLEILYKAGYAFAERLLSRQTTGRWRGSEHLAEFGRLCNYRGRNPKEIFKTTKLVYETLKEEEDLTIWDNIRKIVKKEPKMTQETVMAIKTRNFSSKETRLFNETLAKKYRGKSIFTSGSLLRYLDRIDTYEAICAEEGLQLLVDYIRSCEMIGMEPKTDGDSLKREHDVAARICRQMRTEKNNERFRKALGENPERYDYEEDVFFVKRILTQEDLNDEARQQHNCVACYADSIIKGETSIFVARYKRTPDRSLATVEVRNGRIVQKFLAYNRPIRNKALTDFLKRWQQHIEDVDRREDIKGPAFAKRAV